MRELARRTSGPPGLALLVCVSACSVLNQDNATVTITGTPGDLTNDSTPEFAFTTVGSPTVIECQIDATAFAACASPYVSSSLADGPHAFTVRVADNSGRTTADSHAFTVDTVPPTVAITSGPAGPTNDTTPSFDFTASADATTIHCGSDGRAFAVCTSPFTPQLTDGPHVVTVEVTDAAGNTNAATRSLTVDTVAPTVTITNAPSDPTNDSTPTITFTVNESPNSVQCQVDTGAFAACVSGFTAGVLGDTTHTITVRATDAAGNPGTATAAFTVDTVPPTVTITSQPPALSNNNVATVTFTTGGAPTSTQCQVDAGALASCTSPFTSAAIADGSHTITVRVTDAAGNNATAGASFTIDTVPPTVTINTQPAALSSDNTPTVTFTAAGAPTTIQCQVDAGAFVSCASPFTSSALADGGHTITVKVTDAATNSASATTAAFTIDTVPPTVAITSPPATLSNDNTPTVAFTTGGAPTAIECQVDAGAFVSCASPFTSSALADGGHTITVKVTDAATNSASATTANFTVNPIVMCLGGVSDRGDGDVSGRVEALTTATVEFWFRSKISSGDFELVDFDTPSLYPVNPAVTLVHIGNDFLLSVDARENVTHSGALNQRRFTPPPVFVLTDWHHYALAFIGIAPEVLH